jgi:hypothetical protein
VSMMWEWEVNSFMSRMMRFVVASCLVTTLLICVVDAVAHYIPTSIWRDPPIYPGAKSVLVVDRGGEGREWLETIEKAVFFQTEESIEIVLSYYDQALKRAAWERTVDNLERNIIRRIYHDRSPFGPGATYTFEVSATRLNSGMTKVELRMGWVPRH